MSFVARAVLPATLLLTSLVISGTALAQPDYPKMLQDNFDMKADCVASCGLCHLDPTGGGDRNAWGNAKGTLSARFPAMAKMEEDFDADGATDLAELQAGSDPGNAGSTPATAEAFSICPGAGAAFGCGARLARGTEDDGSRIGWGVLGAALFLKLMRRRRAS